MSALCNGEIHINKIGFRIHSKLKRNEFLISRLYTEYIKNEQDMMNSYSWYYLKPLSLFDRLFGINLCFKNENLFSVQFYIYNNEKESSWENWSEEDELKRKNEHDELLIKLLERKPDIIENYPHPMNTYNFLWGEVSSVYEPRSGSSFVFVKYYEWIK